MREAVSGTLHLTDISSKGLSELLIYIYTGSLNTPTANMDFNLISELVNASEKVLNLCSRIK
jgi:hypothetical protein